MERKNRGQGRTSSRNSRQDRECERGLRKQGMMIIADYQRAFDKIFSS